MSGDCITIAFLIVLSPPLSMIDDEVIGNVNTASLPPLQLVVAEDSTNSFHSIDLDRQVNISPAYA